MITPQATSVHRVVTVGEESVGKTSITSRLIDDTFNQYEPGTVGANYQQYSEEIEGTKMDVQIWDTAGQEKFKSLSPLYFRNAAAAVCVFSLTSKASFVNLKGCIDDFVKVAGTSASVFIAANKCDLVDEFEVAMDEAVEWAQANRYPIFKTSAKTGEGIKEMFKELLAELYRTRVKGRMNLSLKGNKNQKSGCC
jgi:small GTP-binding protein